MSFLVAKERNRRWFFRQQPFIKPIPKVWLLIGPAGPDAWTWRACPSIWDAAVTATFAQRTPGEIHSLIQSLFRSSKASLKNTETLNGAVGFHISAFLGLSWQLKSIKISHAHPKGSCCWPLFLGIRVCSSIENSTSKGWCLHPTSVGQHLSPSLVW